MPEGQPQSHSLNLASSGSLARARASLRKRLQDRRPEIETALSIRLAAVASPTGTGVRYHLGRQERFLPATFEYMLAVIDHGEKRAPEIPLDLLFQARLAARKSVPLESVLRMSFAGYSVLADFVFCEAQRQEPVESLFLQQLFRGQSALFNRFIEVMSAEYRLEAGSRWSREERFKDRIRRLLRGEPVDTSDIDYDLDGHHIAAIGRGSGASEAASLLSQGLDRRLLKVRGEHSVWVWFGGAVEAEVSDLLRLAASSLPPDTSFAVGEAARGLVGWRLSHFQAKTTLAVAEQTGRTCTRYGDVALLASLSRDGLLTQSLSDQYLRPLESERDGGATARATLIAYFSADRNVSSTAAQLGVKRHTVTRRLRTVEHLLGRTLASCALELELALKLEALAAEPQP